MKKNPEILEKKQRGRPTKEASELKKHRGLSLTDSEWNKLVEKAAAAGAAGPSAYVVDKLKL